MKYCKSKSRTVRNWAEKTAELNEYTAATDTGPITATLTQLADLVLGIEGRISWQLSNALYRSMVPEIYSVREMLQELIKGDRLLDEYTMTTEIHAIYNATIMAVYDGHTSHIDNRYNTGYIHHVAIDMADNKIWLPQDHGVSYIYLSGHGLDGRVTSYRVFKVRPINDVGLSEGYPYPKEDVDNDWPTLHPYEAVRVESLEAAEVHIAEDKVKQPYVSTMSLRKALRLQGKDDTLLKYAQNSISGALGLMDAEEFNIPEEMPAMVTIHESHVSTTSGKVLIIE